MCVCVCVCVCVCACVSHLEPVGPYALEHVEPHGGESAGDAARRNCHVHAQVKRLRQLPQQLRFATRLDLDAQRLRLAVRR